ncbi:MAG: hypothetical protein KAT68_17295 [Bacteroidales bacterium]|nr:hypothetical protein [Bacteroidales bacterium]
MKKLSIIILIVLFAVGLNAKFKLSGTYFALSLYIRTCDTDENPVDFIIQTEIEKSRSIYFMIERKRLLGRYYTNFEARLSHIKKYWEVNAKTFNIPIRDIDILHIDARGRFAGFSLGICQEWESKIPATKLIAGKYFYRDLKFFLIPAKFELNSDVLTQDFKVFDSETTCRLNFALSSLFSIRLSTLMRNYSKLTFLTMLSIIINIG